MPKEPDEQVLDNFTKLFDDRLNSIHPILERTWFRNILYYLGEQWLIWFSQQATFGRRYEANFSIPTPVSNIIRDHVRSMKALTQNKRFITKVWPNTNDQDDKDAAELGELVLRWMDTLDDGYIEDVKEEIDLWRVISGNGFARVFPDSDTGIFVTDRDGDVIPSKQEVATEAIIPFNVRLDPLGSHLRHKRAVGLKTLKYKEWVEDTFKTKVDTGDSLAEVDYQRQLMTLVTNVSPWKGRGFESAMVNTPTEDLVVYKEIEFRPTMKYPKGRYQAVVGKDVLINKDEMPIPVDKEGNWDYTLTHFPYNYTPGSFWASGSVDDLISPQNQINEIDQAFAVNRKSLGRPRVVTPADLILKRISERGDGILAIQYDGGAARGMAPQIEPGVSLPQQFLLERDTHRTVAQDAGGDPKNILRGNIPSAKASGVLVDILRESAEQSHGPDIARFHRCWNNVNRKRLILAANLFKESRILKIPDRYERNKLIIRKFKGADLRNNFDVRYEVDSGVSSTNAGRNQMLVRLIETGFFTPGQIKPDVQREVLRRMGFAGFPEMENIHKERAERENANIIDGRFDNIALPNSEMIDPATGAPIIGEDGVPIMMFPLTQDHLFRIDPHEVHVLAHDQFIFSKEFTTLPEETQLLAIAHRDLHIGAMQMEAQEAQPEAPPPQAPPPEPGMEFAAEVLG